MKNKLPLLESTKRLLLRRLVNVTNLSSIDDAYAGVCEVEQPIYLELYRNRREALRIALGNYIHLLQDSLTFIDHAEQLNLKQQIFHLHHHFKQLNQATPTACFSMAPNITQLVESSCDQVTKALLVAKRDSETRTGLLALDSLAMFGGA